MHRMLLQRRPRFRIKPEILAADLFWDLRSDSLLAAASVRGAWSTDIFVNKSPVCQIHASLSL